MRFQNVDFLLGQERIPLLRHILPGIPTLVVGYSVKARGITRDLFGDEEQYSLSVQRLKKQMSCLKSLDGY